MPRVYDSNHVYHDHSVDPQAARDLTLARRAQGRVPRKPGVVDDETLLEEAGMGERLSTLSTDYADEDQDDQQAEGTQPVPAGGGDADDAPEDDDDDRFAIFDPRREVETLSDTSTLDLFRSTSRRLTVGGVEVAPVVPDVPPDWSAEDAQQMFDDEFNMASMMFEDCTFVNEQHTVVRAQVLPGGGIERICERRKVRSKGLFISVTKSACYPHAPPEVTVEPWHGIFTFSEVNALYSALKTACRERVGLPMLVEILGIASDTAMSIIMDGFVVEASNLRSQLSVNGLRDGDATFDGIAPTNYLGSLSNIMSKLPKEYDVLLVENVMRVDLARRFERMQEFFFKKYIEPRQKDKSVRLSDHLAQLADITPAFHGTRPDAISSIVRSGLLVPGQSTGIEVRTGSRYGNGIYSSPDPNLALWYAQGGHTNWESVKLMIVAVLMGKRCVIRDGWEPWGGGCTKGFDSHQSEDGSQLIVFNEAQVLPCYVLHLHRRRERQHADFNNSNGNDPVSSKMNAQSLPQDVNERRALFKVLAKKNLPFGFGPAGTNFVVEDMATYSDDEEEYGDYVAEAREGAEDGGFFEEFQHTR